MPVSPQDFALWSDLTGNPYPQTPAERMALAPEVHSFTRNLGRRGGTNMSPLRRAVDVVGKTALGLGAIAGAAYLGKEYLAGKESGEEKSSEPFVPKQLPPGESQAYAAPEPPTMPTPGGATTEQKIVALGQARANPRQAPAVDESVYDPDFLEGYTQHQWQSHRRNVSERAQELIGRIGTGFTKLEVDNEAPVLPPTVATAGADPLSQAARVSQDVTPPTTAQRYGQNIISGQTAVTQEAKGLSPIKPTRTPIEAKPVTQSEVISGQQSFSPGSELEMVGEDSAQKAAAFRKSAAYAVMQKQYPGLQDIESPSQPASSAPVVLTDVRPAAQIQVATKPESPVAAMSKPAAAPVTAKVEQTSGPTSSEIREMDALLLRSMGNLSQEQRASVRDQMLAKKYKGVAAEPAAVTPSPAPVATATTGPSPESVRFARETARGVSRMGLMAQREAGRAKLAERAEFGGSAPMEASGEESRELADPRVMREMMRRQAPVATPRFF